MKLTTGIVMLFVLWLLAACKDKVETNSEQSVIVHFKYHSKDFSALFAMEKELEQKLAGKAIGEFDGHDLAEDGTNDVLYFYGPDAKRIFEEIKLILIKQPFMDGAEVTVRSGSADDEDQTEVFVLQYRKSRKP